MKVVDTLSGKLVDSKIYMAAEHLLELSKTKGLWVVIKEIIKVWKATNPAKYQASLISFEDVKQSRANEFASTKDKSLRYLLDIPNDIMRMIRILYPVEVLPMDKKFFREMASRFPEFRVPEKT